MFGNAKQSIPKIFQEIMDLDKSITNHVIDFRDPENREYFRNMCKDRQKVRDACAIFLKRSNGNAVS